MNPIDTNRDTHKKIQTSTPGENDHVKDKKEGVRSTKEMDTTNVIQGGENIRT